MLQSIYTHAGCDYGCLYTYSPRHCFNPHTHAGCDLFVHLQCVQNMFQSTHPRRVWPKMPNIHETYYKVSIHTPTQGVTTLAAVNSRNPRVSIHTPTQGVTIVYIGKLYHVPVSIHTPTQGVTQAEVWKVWHRSFNPHTHAGCDSSRKQHLQTCWVSIHTPTQGVTI